VLALVSCTTVTRVAVIPPNVPGATFVGSEACKECHQDLLRDFPTATHARLQAPGPNALNMGCESCHGPGSLHAQSGGDRKTPVNYRPGDPHVAVGSQRLSIINPRRSAEVCYQCHLDKRGQFALPYSHPVTEARISCGDCHDPHKGPAVMGGGTAILSEKETCLKCHPAQRGPHVFEHEALREGCTTCHDPHGSVNPKMLTVRNANLCYKCHVQEVRLGQVLIGGSDHSRRLSLGTCWTAGCHEAVHGSQVSSSLRF
jgi:predicted CXXCH cytochrome family protein